MDIVTQGLLGGSLALAGARRKESRYAAIIGFASGLLADADALIRSPDDPLLTIEFHRHFSHSLFFVPFGAAIAALVLWPLFRKRILFRRLYLYTLLGYATSGFLDSCTSYGTHWLWPLSDERLAWSIISIFDPLFSLILIATLAYGIVKARPSAARVGLLLAGAYLSAGLLQHQRAELAARELAQERSHHIERLVVKPTVGNLVLWRSIYESGGNFHVDAVRIAPFSEPRIYPGARVAKFDAKRDLPRLEAGSSVEHDVSRFIRFSDGFVALDPSRRNLLIDVRYSMLPDSLEPLWGIELELSSQQRHSRFVSFRKMSTDARDRFLVMLFGRELGP